MKISVRSLEALRGSSAEPRCPSPIASAVCSAAAKDQKRRSQRALGCSDDDEKKDAERDGGCHCTAGRSRHCLGRANGK